MRFLRIKYNNYHFSNSLLSILLIILNSCLSDTNAYTRRERKTDQILTFPLYVWRRTIGERSSQCARLQLGKSSAVCCVRGREDDVKFVKILRFFIFLGRLRENLIKQKGTFVVLSFNILFRIVSSPTPANLCCAYASSTRTYFRTQLYNNTRHGMLFIFFLFCDR